MTAERKDALGQLKPRSKAAKLRATIFERSGITVDEHDPIMAVLVACAHQTEEIGVRLLNRTSPMRVVVAMVTAALLFAAVGASVAWYEARWHFEAERAEWLRQQSDPRLAALLRSEQGRAGVRLAEIRVSPPCSPTATAAARGVSRTGTACQSHPMGDRTAFG